MMPDLLHGVAEHLAPVHAQHVVVLRVEPGPLVT